MEVAWKRSSQVYLSKVLKGALNPNFLNLTINRENFCLKSFWSYFLTCVFYITKDEHKDQHKTIF